MPIVENSPWRQQYFSGVRCPEDVVIPTDDDLAYPLFPRHRWVYNKLLICETQGLLHAPHGVAPDRFPVFSKPIYNLRGMGSGSRLMRSMGEYERHQLPGHFWMDVLSGEHISSDVAVIDGVPRWWRHSLGVPLEGGMFDYWTVLAETRPDIEAHCGAWLRRHLEGYRGMVNLETIGEKIIDVHLRFSDQWPDLYGPGWVERLVELYQHNRWRPEEGPRDTGYSVALFGRHGRRYRRPGQPFLDALLGKYGLSSIQITFREDVPAEQHAMPPGGFRLSVINGRDLDKAMGCREELRSFFGAQKA